MKKLGIGNKILFCGLVLGLSLTASAENFEGEGKLAFVGAKNAIYVREEPSVNSRAIAILENNDYVRMYETTEDGWVAIRSGEVTGYVMKERLITGKKAKKLAKKVGQEIGIVYPEALNVRVAMEADAEPLDVVYKDENLKILAHEGDWLKVESPSGVIGYVHSMYCNYADVYDTASLIEPKETPWKNEQEPLVGCQAWRAPKDKDISWQEKLGLEDVTEESVTEESVTEESPVEAYVVEEPQWQVEEPQWQIEEVQVQTEELVEEPQWQTEELQWQEEEPVVEEPQWQEEEPTEEPQWQEEEPTEEPQWQEEEPAEEPQWQTEEPQWQEEEPAEEPQWQTEEPQWQQETDQNETTPVPERNGNVNGQELLDYGMQFVGNPYVWGGTDPVKGSDCSGFTQSIYANFGIEIPRVAADQMTMGYQIPLDQAQVGDLVFYDQTGEGVDHVGIYAGNGMLLHASSPEVGVIVSDASMIGNGPVGVVSYDYSGYLY